MKNMIIKRSQRVTKSVDTSYNDQEKLSISNIVACDSQCLKPNILVVFFSAKHPNTWINFLIQKVS